MNEQRFRNHSVIREDRADGTILLSSTVRHGPVARCSTDWLVQWAQLTPDAIFVAERSGDGWRTVSYQAALEQVRALANGLLDRGLGPDRPLLVISGNSVDHGLIALAAQYAGIPVVPVAEQYALIPAANAQLAQVAGLVKPGMVFAADGDRFAKALNLDIFANIHRVSSIGGVNGITSLAELMLDGTGADSANALVGPDTIAKILMTSGSTAMPKGVLTTQQMMCTNQAQLLAALPFLGQRKPRIVDWLPWNHVFGGSHNFNMMLANGGSLYIDGGKPVAGLVKRTVENMRLVRSTLAFNVPIGFAMLRDAMRTDTELRRSYFEQLDMLFYAGASLPQDVWADLETMAHEIRGDMPLFTTSWGMTETAPACIIQHEPTTMSGIIGVPVPGVHIKLIPAEDGRFELRAKGPNVMPGYHENLKATHDAFDEEGFLRTGDAVKFVDPDNMAKGMRFDGRISEDFKLLTGIWVRAANLRLELLALLKDVAADIIVTGADRSEVGIMIIPSGGARLRRDVAENDGALVCPSLASDIASALQTLHGHGSSGRISRAIILSEPPSIADGEITAKGNLNFRKLLDRRANLLKRLYDNADPATILV